MKMKISDYLIGYLSAQGIDHGFFMIGGALGHIADACARKEFALYTMHHEQAAAFAAEGQAVMSRKPGLAMATSGPGATNLITGIGSAFYASLPTIFVTGQVNTYESNTKGKGRQVGFQETDIVSIIKPITKYAVQVSDPTRAAYEVEKAVFIATQGRPGPVLLDFPLDIQRTEIEPDKLAHFLGSVEHAKMAEERKDPSAQVKTFVTMLSKAKRPILMLGHGVRISGAQREVEALIDKARIPFVATLMGTDAVRNDHPLYFGFIGTYGLRHSNFALANADLVIVLGARLDSRQVGVQASKFAPGAKKIHVDIDPSELGSGIREDLSVCADIKGFLLPCLQTMPAVKERKEWTGFLKGLKETYALPDQEIGPDEISPNAAIGALADASREKDIVSVDVGSHQMWFAQSWKVKRGQVVLTNGGMGPMGCALPTAIGASLSERSRGAWVVCGDGGFQVNIQEMQTVARNKLPIKMVVLNNNSLGMLTQFQTENFEGRLIGSVDGYDAPDFVRVSEGYGIPARRASRRSELAASVSWLASQKGPALLEIVVPRTYWALPKASYNRPVVDMKPLLPEEEMKKALKYVWDDYVRVRDGRDEPAKVRTPGP
ncbi:MAG: thiamine pyrophosphate-binding protein [Candidatus Micrarchaeota archaeon]